jgi:hypothetical protein
MSQFAVFFVYQFPKQTKNAAGYLNNCNLSLNFDTGTERLRKQTSLQSIHAHLHTLILLFATNGSPYQALSQNLCLFHNVLCRSSNELPSKCHYKTSVFSCVRNDTSGTIPATGTSKKTQIGSLLDSNDPIAYAEVDVCNR